jgi:hypothetical protein
LSPAWDFTNIWTMVQDGATYPSLQACLAAPTAALVPQIAPAVAAALASTSTPAFTSALVSALAPITRDYTPLEMESAQFSPTTVVMADVGPQLLSVAPPPPPPVVVPEAIPVIPPPQPKPYVAPYRRPKQERN